MFRDSARGSSLRNGKGKRVRIHLNLLSVPCVSGQCGIVFGRGIRTGVTLSNKTSAAACTRLSKTNFQKKRK